MKILHLDANYLFAANVEEYFGFEGIEVLHATNQNEMLSILNNNHIDVVMIDIFLGKSYFNPPIPSVKDEFGGIGFQILKMIEEILNYKPKIFFVTTLEKSRIRNTGFSTENYYQKPVELDNILLNIKNSCQTSSAA